MPRINIEVETELHKKTKLNSILQDKTLIQYINEAIQEKADRDKAKK